MGVPQCVLPGYTMGCTRSVTYPGIQRGVPGVLHTRVYKEVYQECYIPGCIPWEKGEVLLRRVVPVLPKSEGHEAQSAACSPCSRFTVGRAVLTWVYVPVSLLERAQALFPTILPVSLLVDNPASSTIPVSLLVVVVGTVHIQLVTAHTPSLSASSLIMVNIPDSEDVRKYPRRLFPEQQECVTPRGIPV